MQRKRVAPTNPFAQLGLEPPILRALEEIGFKEPSEIQRAMIPLVLEGRDVLGQARTGTGKTAAFGLPILQRIDPRGGMQSLILAPTRELAAQIVGEVRRFSSHLDGIHCVPVYGGTNMKGQLQELGRKPHIVVGTPGRVMDMMGRRALRLDQVTFAVLDEVDRMLDIGFREDIRKILSTITQAHQTMFVSATISDEINGLARRYMTEPVEVNVSRDEITVDNVLQFYCVVEPWDKFRLLKRLIDSEKPKLAIVFTNTKHGARKLARRLLGVGIECKEIHGDLVQQKREKVMERFRRHKIPVLVATDLASRGIDVSAITHIVNYDVPQDIQAYVHRIGRTARMGASGRAITFATKEQGPELTQIEVLINKQLTKLDVPGFEASAPPREGMADEGPRGRPLPAVLPPPGFVPPAAPQQAAMPRTLGGKFPISRRFRRRR